MKNTDMFLSFLFSSPNENVDRTAKKNSRARRKSSFIGSWAGSLSLSTQGSSTSGSRAEAIGGARRAAHDSKGSSFEDYRGYFSETDLKGNFYECRNLWSTDVAEKWSDVRGSPNRHHQTICQHCNFNAVMMETVSQLCFVFTFFFFSEPGPILCSHTVLSKKYHNKLHT